MKKLKLSIGILVALLLIVLLSWRYILSTPQYSLYQLYNAVKVHDYQTFTKYADVDSVVGNVIDKVMAQNGETANSQGNGWDQLAQGLVLSMKPTLVQTAKNEIKKQVEQGSFQTNYKPNDFLKGFFAIKVKQDGKVADVTLPSQNSKDKPLSLKMRQLDGYWQIFDMNIDLSSTNQLEDTGRKVQNAKFGQRMPIGHDLFVTVSEPIPYTSDNEFEQPKSGNQFLAVDVTYDRSSNSKFTDGYDPSFLKLKDTDGHLYQTSYVTKDPSLSSADSLEAGGKARGWIVFELPINTQLKQAVYSNSDVTIDFSK